MIKIVQIEVSKKGEMGIPEELLEGIAIGKHVYFDCNGDSDERVKIYFTEPPQIEVEEIRIKKDKRAKKFKIIVPEKAMDSRSFYYFPKDRKVNLVLVKQHIVILPGKERDETWEF
ncbi:MAG: hypothetical protein NTZ97_04715 [Candidatus Moranbacteria bacterium]|nr:hypothetical protein [Candidatus Moranbacteria bacterium]